MRRVLAVALLTLASATQLTACSFATYGTEPSSHAQRGQIVAVADGDTVTVELRSGATVAVRLLAIDSPEKYATRYGSPDECGSAAASSFMESFQGSTVGLVADPTQSDRDRYDRLLRYVVLRNGTDLGAAELRRGLAAPYVYHDPPQRLSHYRRLAIQAESLGRGSWGPPCSGDFHSSVPGKQDGR